MLNTTCVYIALYTTLLAQLVILYETHNLFPELHETGTELNLYCFSLFAMLGVRDNIRYLCCFSMHRQQARVWPHSWSSVRATQHAALSSLLWAGPSTPTPVVMLRLRLVSFFSSLAKEITFFLSSRTAWKQRECQLVGSINRDTLLHVAIKGSGENLTIDVLAFLK